MASSSIRRMTTHKKQTLDREELTIITIYEEGIKKKHTQDGYSKQHQFLVKRGNRFKLIEENA